MGTVLGDQLFGAYASGILMLGVAYRREIFQKSNSKSMCFALKSVRTPKGILILGVALRARNYSKIKSKN